MNRRRESHSPLTNNSGLEQMNECSTVYPLVAFRREDVVVLDAAYHGHTTTMMDMSAYKHTVWKWTAWMGGSIDAGCEAAAPRLSIHPFNHSLPPHHAYATWKQKNGSATSTTTTTAAAPRARPMASPSPGCTW